ncbi:DUF488 domain-containing protein [Methanolobus sp. ZRKC3]|uniref:DUF488 domain-containing protein n=1 Tax=Methanolobus sp. ZRKC3 TaxID=3125786 RepID=UPI0032473429
MTQTDRCYTIGYGGRTPDEFIQMLMDNGISNLVDIRRYPHSTFEEFNGESLRDTLPKNCILYYHCEGVGGMRDSKYVEYMETDEFMQSFTRLMTLIKKINSEGQKVVLMCAEKNPKGCHRHYLSTKIEENGIEVIHLVESGQTSLFMY